VQLSMTEKNPENGQELVFAEYKETVQEHWLMN
jgi:hypothetical protein